MAAHPPPTVLYIAGSGRNGSTLLGYLLGSLPGWLNVGEAARYAFNRKMQQRNLPCGCGRPVPACPFWAPLWKQIPPEAVALMTRWGHASLLPLLLLPMARPRTQQMAHILVHFYHQVAHQAQARWIVDTSKHPVPALLLRQAGSLRMYLLHLIRDPLYVVTRWRHPKGWLRRRPVWRLVVQVYLYNLWPELLFHRDPRYLRLRFEDFLERPRSAFQQLLQRLGMEGGPLPFLDARRVRLSEQHALAGNPDKFQVGEVVLRPRPSALPPPAEAWLRAVLYPLRRRYGYVR